MARWSTWSVGGLVLGGIVGLGVSALGAPGDELDPSMRPSPERGREQVMTLLARKERALELREATVSTREADIRAAEEQVEARLAKLQALRDEIRQLLTELDGDREERMLGLVKMFEAMRPAQAAAILATADDPVALEILERMNRAKAGKALASMPPERAAYFANRIGGAALTVEAQ